MKIIRKQHYIYSIISNGKKYTFVTTRGLIEQKRWFDKLHKTNTRYEDISISKIPQSKYLDNYVQILIV